LIPATLVLRRNLDEIFKQLDQLQPKKRSEGGTAHELIAALNLTQEAAEFLTIADIVSLVSDPDSAFGDCPLVRAYLRTI
jgi:hypothetical protein